MAVQISAYISDATKENLEAYSSMYSVKKGFFLRFILLSSQLFNNFQ